MSIEEIKSLLKTGDVSAAETAAQELLATEPDNVQAMMLYGTCRQLQGDEATFRRIHDELASKMPTVTDGETMSLWRKYHKLWIALIVGGLVLAGMTASVVYFGRAVSSQCNVAYGIAIVTNPYNETNVHNAASVKNAESHANKFKDVRSDAESW